MRGFATEDAEIIEMGNYFIFAKEFSFTPRQVREMDSTEVEALKILSEKFNEEQERKIKNGGR